MNRLPLALRPLILCLLALIWGCDKDRSAASGLPTIQMQIGSKSFTLELADNDRDRKYGLMRRDSLASDHGMIFVFAREAPLSFYMRNTRIPLDILYLDRAGKIVSIKQMKPFDESSVPSDEPAQFAVELNEGAADSVGVKVGATLLIPPSIRAKD